MDEPGPVRVLGGVYCDPAILRRLGMPPYTPGAGYARVPCDGCGLEVWLGPNQLDMRHRERTFVACARCAGLMGYGDAEVRVLT